jgi:plasmid stabilization system protein ParE
MSKPIRVDLDAEEEITVALDWCEAQRHGLGREFLTDFREAIHSLRKPGPECRPALGIPAALKVRRKLLRRFPFAIVFVELETSIRIIAVAHARRRPGYWKPRV